MSEKGPYVCFSAHGVYLKADGLSSRVCLFEPWLIDAAALDDLLPPWARVAEGDAWPLSAGKGAELFVGAQRFGMHCVRELEKTRPDLRFGFGYQFDSRQQMGLVALSLLLDAAVEPEERERALADAQRVLSELFDQLSARLAAESLDACLSLSTDPGFRYEHWFNEMPEWENRLGKGDWASELSCAVEAKAIGKGMRASAGSSRVKTL